MSQLPHLAAVNCFIFFSDTDPEVNIPPTLRNITVPENVTEVQICVMLSTGVSEQVVVTAVTGPKDGAENPATGRLSH